MQIHTFDEGGYCKQEGIFEKSQEINKTMNTLGGDGEWQSVYGVKLFVGPDGVILRGPDQFIGRKFDDVKNLNYNDIFTVERSVARAMMTTNKSLNPDDPENKEENKKIMEETKDFIDKTIAIRKAEKSNALVGHDPLYTVDRSKI